MTARLLAVLTVLGAPFLALQISQFPYNTSYDVTNATRAQDDPFCYGANQTVWFAYTPPTNIRLEANTFGSNYDTTLSVYTGARGALTQLACNDDSSGTLQSRVRFDATAGTTYYFMASSLYPVTAANLTFDLLQAPPPFAFSPAIAQFGSVKPSMWNGHYQRHGDLQSTGLRLHLW